MIKVDFKNYSKQIYKYCLHGHPAISTSLMLVYFCYYTWISLYKEGKKLHCYRSEMNFCFLTLKKFGTMKIFLRIKETVKKTLLKINTIIAGIDHFFASQ